MKKVFITIVVFLGFTLTSCFDEKIPAEYYIFVKSSHSENPVEIKYETDNIKKKKQYEVEKFQSSIFYKHVNCVYHLKHPVREYEVSILNNTGSTLQLYARWDWGEIDIDYKSVDLESVWKGNGLISVDSVFNYLKRTNDKGYFEIPPTNGKYFTIQMSEVF